MIFEGFEGFKKIKNEKNLSLEKIYSLLDRYQNEMGKMKLVGDPDNQVIIIDIKGKYDANIRISNNYIIIERILEAGQSPDELPTEEKGKKIELAQADRMIDQIYDAIKDYMDDENVREHITSSKMILRMKETKDKGIFSKGNFFEVINKDNKLVYEIVHKKFNKLFSVKSLDCHMEVTSVNYANIHNKRIEIQEKPFNITTMKVDTTTEKLRFISDGIGKKVKISADYTDNHYLIELNEIVIGAVDCLDPQNRTDYRIEINDLRETHFVVSVAVLIDTYMRNDI